MPGRITLNVDELQDKFAGSFILHPTGEVPSSVGRFFTDDKAPKGTISNMIVEHVDPYSFATLSPSEISSRWPNVLIPTQTIVNYEVTSGGLKLDWSNSLGSGNTVLPRSEANDKSSYVGLQTSWREFKNFADKQPYRQRIFRGQQEPWKLQTAFHRTGRSDPQRYLNEDMDALYRALAGRTRHLYDRRIGEHNGALLHLAQHHGYPTPLLDWSFSPYVAAFFAFRTVRKGMKGNVRIFSFDHVSWGMEYERYDQITSPKLHITVFEPHSFDNERASPQQSISMNTNIVDIEGYLKFREAEKAKTFLQVIDIPYSERGVVMLDLAKMGISAGSMLPGLDGTCEELRERMFPNW